MLKISFIVPIYNDEPYISQCIESLCSLKDTEIEFILVDDGSTDKSLNICYKYADKDSRIKVFHQHNQGADVARNKGLLHAQGKWVCFVDGDDRIEENFCDALDGYFSEDYDVIIYSFYKIYGKKKYRMRSDSEKIEFEYSDFEDLQISSLNRLGPYKYSLKSLDPVSCWNKIYRRDFLLEKGIFFIPEIQKLQDLTFNLQVYSCAQKGLFINVALYDYRYNEVSVTNRYQPDIIEKFEAVHKFLSDYIKNKPRDIFEGPYWERIATHARTCVVLYFCNKKNKKKYIQRKKDFLNLLSREPYHTAVRNADLSHFPIKERILSWAIKHHFFCVCEVLTRLQNLANKLKMNF